MNKPEKNSNLVIILGLIHFFTIMEKFVTESNFMQFLKTMGNYFSETTNSNFHAFFNQLEHFLQILFVYLLLDFFVKNNVISST